MAIYYLPATQDAYVSQYYFNSNFGGSPALYIGRFAGPGDVYRSLLKFDLSSLPSDSTIQTAQLFLYVNRKDVPGSQLVTIYQATTDWNESLVTWNNQPSGTEVASGSILDAYVGTYVSFDITPLVQSWYYFTTPNTGIIIQGVETSNALIGFASAENPDSNITPFLFVNLQNAFGEAYNVALQTVASGANVTFDHTGLTGGGVFHETGTNPDLIMITQPGDYLVNYTVGATGPSQFALGLGGTILDQTRSSSFTGENIGQAIIAVPFFETLSLVNTLSGETAVIPTGVGVDGANASIVIHRIS